MIKKPKFIYNDLYHSNIWFYDNHAQEHFLADVKKRLGFSFNVNDARARTIELTTEKHNIIVIWINRKQKIKEVLTGLGHECVHATNIILARAGVYANHDNDEAQAYLHEWIFDRLIKDLKLK